MVQEFHVLRCYSCQTYQVQQVKKSKKWNCKLCGEKQSFGRGSGVDCRRHVQKVNARRGDRWSKYLQTSDEGAGQVEAEEEENVYMDRNHLQGNINVRYAHDSCKANYFVMPVQVCA
uniref:MRN complex-interacting protein N-terminal domain-containing protein n=1 Tax=Salmo trutta TaxID=8032 RepID=A0A674ATC4_SALTR